MKDENGAATREDQRTAWQKSLLPLMGSILLLAGLFFSVLSVLELRSLYAELRQEAFDLGAAVPGFRETASTPAIDLAGRAADLENLAFRTRAALEANAMERRYHQGTAAMLARVWTRQLGFITGMLLALVGAAFILGRLNEPETAIAAEGQGLKGSLRTSSPGIVLALLGSVLMGITIVIPFEVETTDANLYLLGADPGRRASANLPPPAPILLSIDERDGAPAAVTEQGLADEAAIFGSSIPGTLKGDGTRQSGPPEEKP